MHVVEFFRASVLNSSSSAFYLAVDNNKYMGFACKLLNVKNENAHYRLTNQCSNNEQRLKIRERIDKYESLLYMLENVYSKVQ